MYANIQITYILQTESENLTKVKSDYLKKRDYKLFTNVNSKNNIPGIISHCS